MDLFGGALGLSGIPEQADDLMIYGLLAAAIAALWLVGRSGIGRAMEAMREDETAAAVMGVNPLRYKMGALLASAALAGLAGCLNAHVSSFIGPGEYGFEPAVTILSYALLGGIGTPLAPVLGAFILTLLPELLRGLSDLRLVLNGVIIVVAVLFLPGGHPSLAVAAPRRVTALLEVAGLTRRFAGLVAVDGVDMRVAQGGIHAVIGPNGAGKTTLFNLISGLLPPTAGRILLAGQDVTRLPAHRRAGLGVARTFQNIRIFGGMTVLENVLTGAHPAARATLPEVIARLPRFRRQERQAVARAQAALALVGLADAAGTRAAALSYGDARRLEIARAMAGHPRLLLLDEPAAGLNPSENNRPRRPRPHHPRRRHHRAAGGARHGLRDGHLGRRDRAQLRQTHLRRRPRRRPAGPGGDRSLSRPQGRRPARRRRHRRGARRMKGLRVEGLVVGYGRTIAVKGVDLAVDPGQVVCLIGANGAGKTTVMRALSGLLRPRAGRIVFGGGDIAGQRAYRIAAAGVAPGAGRPPGVRQPDGGRQPPTRAPTRSRTGRNWPGGGTPCSPVSPACVTGLASLPVPCRAASSRCWHSAAR